MRHVPLLETVCILLIVGYNNVVRETSNVREQVMQAFKEASSFATRKNAVRKLEKVLGDKLPTFDWVIIAQEDGRFSPLVTLWGEQTTLAAALAGAGVCVQS